MNDKLRVMLIFPPVTRPEDFSAKKVRVSPFFPMGIAYLAAVLEKEHKYEVMVLDTLIDGDLNGINYGNKCIRYGLTDESIEEKIKLFKPDILGVSCLFSAMEWDALNIFSIAKRTNPNIITIMGGPHAGGSGKAILDKDINCDFVLIGEGEESLKVLLRELDSGKPDLTIVDGLFYRREGSVELNPKAKYIHDLDSIPFPARHLFDMSKYMEHAVAHSSYKNKPFTNMLTSRGCPAKCTFCAIENHWGKRQRIRSAKNVLDEIENLINTYGIKEIHFEDDNLTYDRDRAIKIFDGMIERKFNISWTVPSGMAVYALDDELLTKMRDSGCYSVSLAIENGNQDVVTKIMHKPVDLKKVPSVVKKIRELGMEVRGFFILGYPGETKENMEETINFAKELELDWSHFFIFSPLPGTRIYKTCIEKGYMKESDFDPLRSFYKPLVKTPEFDQDYLVETRERAIIDVNFINNPNLLKYDIDKAITSFKNVVDIYPHFIFANYYLAEAYLKKGERELAKQYFSKVMNLDPTYQDVSKKLISL